jgi:perosamine synthetase
MAVNHIPWAKPDFWGNEENYVLEALKSTWISGGRFVDKLEEEFRKVLGKKYCLAVSNGTTAIHLAYFGLNVRPGDEIIIPGFCFLAAANVAVQMGAKPVFAEVDPDTWCLDPIDLRRKITSKTKAIVPVHTYGNVCDMSAIMSIANEKGIPVIEDCAESLFSTYKGKQSGTFGIVNTFSFQATKTITTGEGGLVVTDDDAIAETMALYRSHGMNRQKVIYWHEVPGHNFRLTNMQAALGVAQLEEVNKIIGERRRVYETYCRLLKNIPGLELQKITPGVDPLIWAVALKLDPESFPQGREEIMKSMHVLGIETRPGFFSSSILEIYHPHSLPVCEYVSKNVISVPSYPTLKDNQIEYICEQLLKQKRAKSSL